MARQPGTIRPTIFVLLPALFAVGLFWPGIHTWGFDSLSSWRPSLGILTILATLLLFVTPIAAWVGGYITPVLVKIASRPTDAALVWRTIGAVGLFLVLFLLRSQSPFYGDGFEVIASSQTLNWPDSFAGQQALQPLSVLVYHAGFVVLSKGLGLTATNSFGAVSCFFGVLGFLATSKTAGRLGTDALSRVGVFLVMLASGSVLLFFGYVEYYTPATVMALFAALHAIDYVREEGSILPAILFGLIASAFHMIALPVIVTISVLGICVAVAGRESIRRVLRIFGILSFVGALAITTVATFLSGFPIFVPIIPKEANPYWSLSLYHIQDTVNLLALLAPVGIILLLSDWTHRHRRAESDNVSAFLGSLALVTFLASFWIDPLMSAVRDWDLLSFYGLFVSMYAAYRWIGRKSAPGLSITTVIPLAGVALLCIAPRVAELVHRDQALVRLDSLLWNDVHYTTAYDNGYRCLSWGFLLQSHTDQPERATKYFRRRLVADTDSPAAWYNIGLEFATKANWDSAYIYFARASTLDPDNGEYLRQASMAALYDGQMRQATALINRALALNPRDAQNQFSKGVVETRLNHLGQALAHFRAAMAINPQLPGATMNVGLLYSLTGQSDSACIYLSQALTIQPDEPRIYEALIKAQVESGRVQEARATLARLEALLPNPVNVQGLRNLIDNSTGSESTPPR